MGNADATTKEKWHWAKQSQPGATGKGKEEGRKEKPRGQSEETHNREARKNGRDTKHISPTSKAVMVYSLGPSLG
jgi:hypothetical protein